MMDDDMVMIPTERYDELLEIELKFDALWSAGVDSWAGYEEAMNILNDEGC